MEKLILNIKRWNTETNEYELVKVDAELVSKRILGKKLFIHDGIDEDKGYIVLSEYETGGKITKTILGGKRALLKACRELITKIGQDRFIQTIDDTKQLHGIVNN